MSDPPAPERLAARDLLEKGRQLGFLGPGPVEDHVRHSLAFGEVVFRSLDPRRASFSLLDLGSGGGVPGLVVAEKWPNAAVSLLDASERRCHLLEEWIREAGLERIGVLCGRAEQLGRDPGLRGSFDAVVARSFGIPAVTAECAAPFLKTGGVLVVSDPPRSGSKRWSPAGLELLGLEVLDQVSDPFHFTVLRQAAPSPDAYPRRTGIPAKRPLF